MFRTRSISDDETTILINEGRDGINRIEGVELILGK